MSHTDATYVIFDGDEDGWAYRFMRGWKANEKIDFDFNDAHDLHKLTKRADDEEYIKGILRKRMEPAAQVLVLVGEKTKNLYKYVRWELELALEEDKPIIVANLNESKQQDEHCPAIIRDECVLHVPFKMKIIQYAMDKWPPRFASLSQEERKKGYRIYNESVYEMLELE